MSKYFIYNHIKVKVKDKISKKHVTYLSYVKKVHTDYLNIKNYLDKPFFKKKTDFYLVRKKKMAYAIFIRNFSQNDYLACMTCIQTPPLLYTFYNINVKNSKMI